MGKTQILHVAVDKPTEKTLRLIAKYNDLPLSAVLRRAIAVYLSQVNTQALKSKEQAA